jgi:GNAT superfamily N-acetyltransferase
VDRADFSWGVRAADWHVPCDELQMPSLHTIERLDPQSATDATIAEVAQLLCRVWPKPGRTPEGRAATIAGEFAAYDGPPAQAPRGYLIRDQGRVVAHGSLLPRTICVGEQRHTIGGLARVCSDPACRGQGLGALVVQAAFGAIDQGDFAWSLFQTSPQVRPFYEKLGAGAITNGVVNSLAENPRENPFWDEVAMVYPARAIPGELVIDLLGPGW